MANLNLQISEDLQEIIKKHREINWEEVVRKALLDHAMKIEIIEKLTDKSKLNEKDAEEIGEKVKRGIAKRHGL